MSKKSMLLDMMLDEISLVDKGANDGARVVIFKRADGTPKTLEDVRKYCGEVAACCPPDMQPVVAETFDELLNEAEIREKAAEFYNLIGTLHNSMETIHADRTLDEQTKLDLTRRSVEEFKAAVEAELLTGSAESGLEKSKRGGSTMTIEELEKRLGELEQEKISLTKRAEEAEAKIAKVDGAACTLDDKSEGVMKDGVCIAKVAKAEVPADIKKAMDVLTEENRVTKAALAKLEDDRATAEYVAKAKDLGPLPIKAEDLGPVLKAAAGGMSKEQYAVLEGVLKGAGAAYAKLGVPVGAGTAGAATAYAKLEELAKAKQAEAGISFEKAFAEIRKGHPALWKQHRDEQRAAH